MIAIPRYLCSQDNAENSDIIILGIPYDCTSSFRPGSRFASREVRIISEEAVEEFSFHLGKSLEDIHFYDMGDMPLMVGDPSVMIKEVENELTPLIKSGKKVISIGGEHLVTYPVFKAYRQVHKNFTILHLDAHADLRKSYSGDALSHASVLNLCLENGLEKLVQYGIRSGTREEYHMRQEDKRINPCSCISELENCFSKDEKIYITLDVDFFDPGFFPGTGTPEAGGASYNDFLKILSIMDRKKVKIIGADIVELAPGLDPTGNSTIFTAKLLRDLLIFTASHP